VRVATTRVPCVMRGVKKENLPSKVCVVCERPFTWRKKWERCWDEVTTCSKSCNAKRKAAARGGGGGGGGGDAPASPVPAPAPAPDAAPPEGAVGVLDAVEPAPADPEAERRRAHKEAVKAQKAERRARREGAVSAGQKPCDVCAKDVDLLVRCRTDASGAWRMVCGRCWTHVSGGVVDGDAAHPHYRYGGLWKNRRAPAPDAPPPPPALANAAAGPPRGL